MKLKKLLSIVLAVAMIMSTMSFNVFADGETVEAVAEVSSNDELIEALAASSNVKIKDDFTVYTAITVPDGVEIDLNGNTLNWNVENSYFGESTIKGGSIVLGKDDVHVCDGYFLVNDGKTLTVDGVTISSSENGMKCYAVFHLKKGAALSVNNSIINVAVNEYAPGYVVYANESTAKFDFANSTMTSENVAGVVHAATKIENSTVTIKGTDGTEMEHGINRSALTITNSTVTISGGTGRGITAQHGDLVIDGNSKVSVLEMGEATIKLLDDKSMTVADNAEVKVDVDVNNTGVGTVTGTVDRLPNGSITPGYASYADKEGSTGIWGEGKSNANESYVVELYAGDNKIAEVSLNDVDNIMDGTYKNLTWTIPYAGSTDKYWNVTWYGNNPIRNAQPTKVVFIVDGNVVDENVVKMSAPDDFKGVVWEELENVKPAPGAKFLHYAAYAVSDPISETNDRERFGIDVYNIVAYESFAVESYYNDKLIATTTYRETDRADGTPLSLPNGSTTVNVVVKGRLAGSWDTVWHSTPNVTELPNAFKVYVDGELADEFEGAMSEENQAKYKALTGTEAVAEVNGVEYGTLQYAVDSANENDTVTVIGDVSDENVTVSKNVTITSDEDNKATLNNVTITTVAQDIDVTVSNLKFTGDSYIHAENGKALTVTGVEGNVTPTKITGRAAFIVTGKNENATGLELNVTNNTIIVSKGNNKNGDDYAAAIFGWRYLDNGTTISNNTFGSEDTPLYFVAVKTMNAINDATFTITNNTVYGSNAKWHFKAFDLYQNCSRDNNYTVISKSNKVNVAFDVKSSYSSCAFYLEGNGGTNLILLDNGTTVNGEAVTMNDIDASGLPENYNKFYGINVTRDENGKIIGGIFSVAPAVEYLAENYEAVKNHNTGFYSVIKEEKVVNTDDGGLVLKLVPVTNTKSNDNINVYDIMLASSDGTSDIYEFIAAELTFENKSKTTGEEGSMKYVVTANDKLGIVLVENAQKPTVYGFHIANDANRISDNEIKLGQIQFVGAGEVNFKVTDALITATLYNTNDELYYSYSDGTVDITDATASGKLDLATYTNLDVNIDFVHDTESEKDAAYNAITVTVTGPLGYKKVGKVGLNATDADVSADVINNKVALTFPEVVVGYRYNVKLEAPGYRTFSYNTVVEEEGKSLLFWNDAKTGEKEDPLVSIETGKTPTDVTFLVGDIAMDYIIDKYDLAAVTSYYGTYNITNSNLVKYDLNRDGDIDIIDIGYVIHGLGY